ADQSFRDAMDGPDVVMSVADSEPEAAPAPTTASAVGIAEGEVAEAPTPEVKTESDPFDEIDFGSYFDEYLDPGYKSPASENVEKPSFETFLSSPVTLSDHLRSQLALVALTEA